MSNLDKYKTDLESLVQLGEIMDLDLTFRHLKDQGELDKKHHEAAKKVKGNLFVIRSLKILKNTPKLAEMFLQDWNDGLMTSSTPKLTGLLSLIAQYVDK